MIAISYRREDSLPVAGRLYDRLQAKFGRGNVFMDFDSIPPGVDFREQIEQMIERSSLVIALIGPKWLGPKADSGRRIHETTDFVRLEIAYALKRNIPIVPVLIDNTVMPTTEELPADIGSLASRTPLRLDTGVDFHRHVDRLISGISQAATVNYPTAAPESEVPAPRLVTRDDARKVAVTAALLSAITVAGAMWFFQRWSREQLPERVQSVAPAEIATPPTIVTPKVPIPTAPAESTPSNSVIPELQPSPEPSTTREELSVAPSSPPVTNARPWQETIGGFVREFVDSTDLPDANATASFYAAEAEMFGEGRKNFEAIKRDIEEYNQRWPLRKTSIIGDVSLTENVPSEKYTARFQESYFAQRLRVPPMSGKAEVELTVSIRDGLPKISSIRQKIIHRDPISPFIGTWEGMVQSPYGNLQMRIVIDAGEFNGNHHLRRSVLNLPDKGQAFVALTKTRVVAENGDEVLLQPETRVLTDANNFFTLSADGKTATYSVQTPAGAAGGTLYRKK